MRALRTVLLLCLSAAFLPAVVSASDKGAEVLVSAENRVVVRLEFRAPEIEEVVLDGQVFHRPRMENCVPLIDPGHPEVPARGVLVGIPFGVEPRVRLLDVRRGGELGPLRIVPAPTYEPSRGEEIDRLVPRYDPDASIYGRGAMFPEEWVEAGWDGTLRFQRVLQVSVFPLKWNPAGGGEWADRVTFEVSWDNAADLKGLGSPPVEPLWEGTYRRAVVNAEGARRWRQCPAPAPAMKRTVQRTDEFKLIVTETGLYEVRYEDLDGLAGSIPNDEFGIYRKVYSDSGSVPWEEAFTPIHLVDADGDGNFGAGDRFYFWAENFQDAYVVYGFEDRYAQENVYWFGTGPAGGTRMDSLETWEGAAAGTLETFPEVLHFEIDAYYEDEPNGPDYDGLPPQRDAEQWFWTWYNEHEGMVGIQVHDQDPATLFGLRSRFVGGNDGTHYITPTLLNGASQYYEMDEFHFFDYSEYIFDSGQVLPNTVLLDGANYFLYEGYRETGGQTLQRTGAFLDWVELTYDRRLTARDDYLVFNSGQTTGAAALLVEGFTDPSILLFDITDPGEVRRRMLPSGAVEEDGGTYRLTFADSLGAKSAGAARWVAVANGGARRFSEDRVLRDEPSSLHSSEGDYVVIAHPLFLDGIAPLVAHRESQGFQVQVADVHDVYDEFNGGMKDPVAIKRYLRWGFDHWTKKPQFVLLVGDASEDHRGIYVESGPDFVPTVSTIAYSELAAIDNWFVRLDDDSYLLDLYLGRLSVGSEAELETVVDKILAYEQFSPDDAWRGRVVLLSDDLCSSVEYSCMRGGDLEFESATRDAAAIARASPGGAPDVVEIHLSEYTGYTYEDGYHGPCYGGTVTQFKSCLWESVYANVTPLLFENLNEGAMLFTFQGHGNRKTVFDEFVILDTSVMISMWRSDVTDFSSNSEKPYIVHGFGCHFADFDEVEEEDDITQESILEKMLFLPNKGAVAVLGSTALEAANTNAEYERQLYRAFFDSPPTAAKDGGDRARWLLGEVQATSIAYLAANPVYDGPFLSRYVLLGDPALRIDALPPSMRATIDGVVAEDGGVITAGDSAVVIIRVEVGDEVAVDSTSISVGIQVSDGVVNLTAGEDFRVVRDSTVTGGRVYVIEYAHEIQFADYDLVFGAQDRNGRAVSFTLRVRFAFEVWFDGRVAMDGSRVMPGAQGVAEVTFPRKVEESELSVKLSGAAGDQVLPAVKEPLNDTGTGWRVSFSLEGVNPGVYDLVFVFGTTERVMMSFEIADRLRIDAAAAYPTPFEEETAFTFVLSRSAETTLRVFTVAGRRIRTLEHNGSVDFNHVSWDGRDQEGDEIANGVYLYQITAKSGDEVAKSDILRVVKMK